jgi:hypothetical protein
LPDGHHVGIPEVAHPLVYTAPEPLAGVIRPFLEEARGSVRRRDQHSKRRE